MLPNFIHLMLSSRNQKLWKGRSRKFYSSKDSADFRLNASVLTITNERLELW